MSALRRVPLERLRHLKPRAGGHNGGSFWSEGTQEKVPGNLFSETPTPPGQSRKWESWELPWYSTMVASAFLFLVAFPARPDSTLESWARKEAQKELKAEGL